MMPTSNSNQPVSNLADSLRETVITFERAGYPTFKNWKAICQVGRENRTLMWAIAAMSKKQLESELGKRLIVLFPECFSDKPISGYTPWSYIQKLVVEKMGIEEALDSLYIPWRYYSSDPSDLDDSTYEGIYAFPDDTKVGAEFGIDGGHYVIVQNLCPHFTLVPDYEIDFTA